MSTMVNSVEIDRSPAEVFAFVTDPNDFTEWQHNVVSASLDGEGPMHEGSTIAMTHRMGGRQQSMTTEMTEYDEPRGYTFRGVDGPVRALGRGSLEPLGNGERTCFTFELDFEGHGIGRLLVPLVVRRQAKEEMVESHAALKSQLENTQT